MKNILLLITFIMAQGAFASATQFDFKPEMGKVVFKTKGWPNLVVIKGEGQGVTGALTETAGKVSGELTFDLTTLKTGITLRDDHMKDNYLEVKKHPTAKLSLKEVSLPEKLDGSMKFKGMMTLHGVEKEVSGEAKLANDSGALTMSAELPIKLSDFKIAIPNYKGITVAEKVKVSFETKVKKQ